jgi:hypothetical protein
MLFIAADARHDILVTWKTLAMDACHAKDWRMQPVAREGTLANVVMRLTHSQEITSRQKKPTRRQAQPHRGTPTSKYKPVQGHR